MFFSLAFFAVIFMEMLSDLLLVADRCTAWKALNGNVSEAEFQLHAQEVNDDEEDNTEETTKVSSLLMPNAFCNIDSALLP